MVEGSAIQLGENATLAVNELLERKTPAGQPAVNAVLEVARGAFRFTTAVFGRQRGERDVQLTPIEFRLLYILACNAGRVVSSERLVDYVWGPTEGDKSLLKTHICHIRSKLKLPSSGPGSINAIPRVGYRLAVAPKSVPGDDAVIAPQAQIAQTQGDALSTTVADAASPW